MVDPYDWLDLPKQQRPPDPFELLGVDRGVVDPIAIRTAADRQLRRVLPYLTGVHVLEAERLYSEIEDARDTLVDPDRRAQYQARSDEMRAEPTDSTPAGDASESPLSPDELAAATLPDPNPWWKSTPEATTKPEPWWKESAPDQPGPPPPQPLSIAVAPAPTETPTAPEPKRPRSMAWPIIIVGTLLMTGLAAAGIYWALQDRSQKTGPAIPIVDVPRNDNKPKTPSETLIPKNDSGVEKPKPKVPAQPRVKPEVISGPLGKPPAHPLLVPDSEQVAMAMVLVRKELAREFSYDRPDEMAQLADNLRRRAALDRLSLSLRFGLLQEALSLAIKAGDVATAFRAIEDKAAWFDIDEMAEKARTLAAFPKEAEAPAILELGITTAERGELEARPEVVERLLRQLPDPAPKGELGDRLTTLRQRLALHVEEMKRVKRAVEILSKAPDHEPSNHDLGLFLCLARQDWSAGLPHLAKGTDQRLVEAAKADLASPADPKMQHRVGEMWYSLAIEAKDHRAKRAMLGRALYWFEHELNSKIGPDDAAKAKTRLDEISKLALHTDRTTLPLLMPLFPRRAYNTLGPDVLSLEWKLAGAEAGPEGVLLSEGSPVMSSRFGLGPGGRLTMTIRTDGREIRINCGGQEFAFAGTGKWMHVTIERVAVSITVSAASDDVEPVIRTSDLPMTARGPTRVALRLTRTASIPGGALITSAIVRGPVSLPLPPAE